MARGNADKPLGSGVFTPMESFLISIDGVDELFTPNVSFVADDDPILRSHGHLFAHVRTRRFAKVEQATAGPGEVRQ